MRRDTVLQNFPLLSLMQKNAYQRNRIENISCKRGRHTGAEPITRRFENAVIGSFYIVRPLTCQKSPGPGRGSGAQGAVLPSVKRTEQPAGDPGPGGRSLYPRHDLPGDCPARGRG